MSKGAKIISVRDLLRYAPGEAAPDLSSFRTDAHPGTKDKDAGVEGLGDLAPDLFELQARLFAAGKGDDPRRVLLVLQGIDASGKDGTVKHVLGLVNPLGLRLRAFGRPTEDELQHDFLWRIRNALPVAGEIGVFNRSHYEDVIVPRARGAMTADELHPRYAQINAFERELAADGVTLVKVFLHLGADAQKERMLSRLTDPSKFWKYNPADLDDRERWSAFQEAYAAMLHECHETPWYVVPADRKWYRNWAIGHLLTETLDELDPQYPEPDFDVDAEIRRLK